MFYDYLDPAWPACLVHHTRFEFLQPIVRCKALHPGGTKPGNPDNEQRRPIYAEVETPAVANGAKFVRRADCNVAIFFNMLYIKEAVCLSRQRLGLCQNGAAILMKPVPLDHLLRIQAYAVEEDGVEMPPFTIWRHPGDGKPLVYKPCPQCASKGEDTQLPSGTDICCCLLYTSPSPRD